MGATISISKSISLRSVCVLILFLFTFTKMAAQQKSANVNSNFQSIQSNFIVTNNQNTTNSNSDIEFISWFMGTEQKLNAIEFNFSNTRETTKNKKRQMISSGIIPNRILYKVILQKMVNQDSVLI